MVKNKLSLYLMNLRKQYCVFPYAKRNNLIILLPACDFFVFLILALAGVVTATYVTKWCLCTSRCFNKTHYLAGSYFIDG